MSWVPSALAWQIPRYDNLTLEIEGHTEKGFLPPKLDYGTFSSEIKWAHKVLEVQRK